MVETPLTKKLMIKPGQRLLALNAPEGYLTTLGAEATTEADPDAQGIFDFVQVFARNKADLDRFASAAIKALKPGGLLWFCYPKLTSKIKSDITRDTGWDVVQKAGMIGVSLIAIDETWSAMRFRAEGDVKPKKKR